MLSALDLMQPSFISSPAIWINALVIPYTHQTHNTLLNTGTLERLQLIHEDLDPAFHVIAQSTFKTTTCSFTFLLQNRSSKIKQIEHKSK
jgi:hypothetical protein